MAITLVAALSAAPGASGGTTAALTTTGATLLVVGVSTYWLGGATAVSDSKGNLYSALSIYGGVTLHQLWYCLSPTVGTGHTVTVSGSYPAILVYAFSGVSSYQTESGATAAGTASLASGSVTPAANGALIVTGNAGDTAVTESVTPVGFALTQVSFGGGNNMEGNAAWQVQPTAAAINPTWAFSPSGSNVAVSTAVFLPTAGPAAVETTQPYVWGPL